MNLITLQLKTTKNFNKNLSKLIKNIEKAPIDSIILAPELYLTGYSYDRLEEASNLTKKVINILKFLSHKKIIAITMTTKKDEKFYNTLHIFYNGMIVHTQSKAKLFVLDDERKYFTKGDENDIKITKIAGIKVATLICFELRFVDLIKKVQGADIILIPAMWGKLRKDNFKTLTKALAVTNQCFVLASNSANSNMAKSSAIISPFGEVVKNNQKNMICVNYDKKEIKKMRRYLNVGIN